jgi:hypothetical protein
MVMLLGPWIATETLISWIFSSARLPPETGRDVLVLAVLINTPVSLILESIIVIPPTFWAPEPVRAVISMPTEQFWIDMPAYVQPQSKPCLIAVPQFMKVRFRMVNCWFPNWAPNLPPMKVMSARKPAEPVIKR